MTGKTQQVIVKNVQLPDRSGQFDITIRQGYIETLKTAASMDPVDDSEQQSAVIDGSGHYAILGMTDLFSRLREPGLTRKGNIKSETKAALRAGFTEVFCSPDTSPAIDNVATVQLILQRAKQAQYARVTPIAALTLDLQGKTLSELATLQATGCITAGQADTPLESSSVLCSAMEYSASFELPLHITARDSQLGANGCAHAGAIATKLGLPEIPVAAETVPLARLLELVRQTGCRLHVSRVSSARALEMIEAAKNADLPVSCDVGLHHLFFTDENLRGYDSSFHSAVPFRSVDDRLALRRSVASGLIDAICTDHAPHDLDASLAPLPSTEPGLTGYQWAIPLILQLPDLLELSLHEVFSKLNTAPRQLFYNTEHTGLTPGSKADFFLLSPDENNDSDTPDSINHPLNFHSATDLNLQALKGSVPYVFSDLKGYNRDADSLFSLTC